MNVLDATSNKHFLHIDLVLCSCPGMGKLNFLKQLIILPKWKQSVASYAQQKKLWPVPTKRKH